MTNQTRALWWTWFVAGLVTLGVGVLVLAEPGNSLKALAVIAGLYLLLDSAMAFVTTMRRDNEHRELSVLHAVLSLVIGLILVRHPIETITAIAMLIGIWLIAVGAVRLVGVARDRRHGAAGLGIALVQLVGGIVIVANPNIGYGTLALIAGISLTLQGIGMIVLGWSLRGLDDEDPAAASYEPRAAV